MKKLFIVLLALGLVVAFSMPACAVENIFGGYWRTRAFMQKDFDGTDTGAKDQQLVDTRTRIYYTAKFSDNFKFVNKFEFNHYWGQFQTTNKGAGIGTDNTEQFRIKNSYVDFNVDSVNAKIGLQGYKLARGFLFSDDVAGAVVTYKGDGFSVPFAWLKAYEGGKGIDANEKDVDYYAIAPKFTLDNIKVNPYLLWITSDDYSGWNTLPAGAAALTAETETDIYYLGVDVDAKVGAASVWATGIYETGSVEEKGVADTDISAYLVALGGSTKVGAATVRGQFFYATGDDADADYNAFWVPKGQCYYWSEILGYGIFDTNVNDGCGYKTSDIMAFNLGATLKPMDKVTVKLDLWNANLAEDDSNGETSLGTEVDVVVTYALLENLKLDVVAAYLFAGDATTGGGDDDANPYEFGTRLSFSF
ncbi:MAG: hypothetical protein JRC86_02845 [Deltaproteobacteria bacterium]|nr:hypothetical protein [Deltaproteobacteria bacterium]